MEWELRALGEYCQQNQPQYCWIQRVCEYLRAGIEHDIQLVAANDTADQQHATKQSQTTGPGDHQRHLGALTRVVAAVPEPDQQERTQAGQLPEHHQQDQIARDHHAQHCTHEQQQVGEKTRSAIVSVQVIVGIHHNQPADTQDQASKHPGQPVNAQAQRQASLRNPRQGAAHHFASHDLRRNQGQHQQAKQRCQAGDLRDARTRSVPRQCYQDGGRKRCC